MEKSKYVKYQKTTTPRHRRSKVAEGSFEERNRYYHCWSCGQMIDMDKISGNPETGGAYNMVLIVPSELPGFYGNYQSTEDIAFNLMSTADPFLNNFVSLQTYSDGTPIPISTYNPMSAETTTGVCPLCATANLP